MRQVTATNFARQFASVQHDVHHGAVVVTSHGRTMGYFVSPEEYAELDALREKARHNLIVGQLPDDVAEGLRSAKMDPRHAHLNDLMKP